MISDYISNKICSQLGFEPTASQRQTAEAMANFIVNDDSNPVLLINGFAGTGKTSLLRTFCNVADEMKFHLELMAPTGRAAKVLAGITGRTAHTVHKVIYRQDSADDIDSPFSLNYNRNAGTIFVVDEASMISNFQSGETAFGSGRLLDDIIAFVFSRPKCRLLLVGDSAQLPPVGTDRGPAMDVGKLGGYDITLTTAALTDIVRQEENSGILLNANIIRKLIEDDTPDIDLLRFDLSHDDVERIGGADLIEAINTCYDKFGVENTLVITRSNKRANRFNQGIRNAVMFREEEVTRGDLLMVVKNNYFWLPDDKKHDFIANGDIAEIVRINGYQEMYGFRFADTSLCFADHEDIEIDAKILLDNLVSDAPRPTRDDEERLFAAVAEDYADMSPRQRTLALRNNKWFNALAVKFAYAVTCHKAQGGQWDAVFVDLGYFTDDMMNIEMLKWLYTAVTRATRKLYLINFNDCFFE